MQFCKVEIKLNGDMTNTIIKDGVSVPEIVLLRAIHGAVDAVTVLEVLDDVEVSNRSELERLNIVYSSATDSKAERWVSSVFPGMGVVLPQTLSDIGDSFVPPVEAPSKGRKRKQAEVEATDPE
jgi:hypothetical protein